MKLEHRYIIFKISDLGNSLKCDEVRALARQYNSECRISRGKPALECLVIEKDWPEYEPALKLLSARVDGVAPPTRWEQDNERAANEACNVLGGLGYHWTGSEWVKSKPRQSAKGLKEGYEHFGSFSEASVASPWPPLHKNEPCKHVVTEAPAPRKHNHYFKDVSRFELVDVYRILELFDVTNPAIAHAVKKLLVAGGRGAGKDIHKDIQEAIDTLVRWQDMRKEDEA
jgi:hypothetical protein